MKRQIVQWGNSLGIRIPNRVFQKTAFKEGDDVEIEIEDDYSIIIRKITKEEDDADETVSAED